MFQTVKNVSKFSLGTRISRLGTGLGGRVGSSELTRRSTRPSWIDIGSSSRSSMGYLSGRRGSSDCLRSADIGVKAESVLRRLSGSGSVSSLIWKRWGQYELMRMRRGTVTHLPPLGQLALSDLLVLLLDLLALVSGDPESNGDEGLDNPRAGDESIPLNALPDVSLEDRFGEGESITAITYVISMEHRGKRESRRT